MTPAASPSTDARPWSLPETSAWLLDDWLTQTNQCVPDQDSERWVSYHIDDLYPDWQMQAHCRGVGVNYYFGDDDEQPTMSIRQVRAASKLCDVCPVFTECLTWALSTREEYGVWAGTSGRVRRRIFKMVDNGEVSVPQVVEDFRNGRGNTYRLPQGGSSKTPTLSEVVIGASAEGGAGLLDEGGREAAV
jgi:WhiB family redox-sensing transcriptional regulator